MTVSNNLPIYTWDNTGELKEFYKGQGWTYQITHTDLKRTIEVYEKGYREGIILIITGLAVLIIVTVGPVLGKLSGSLRKYSFGIALSVGVILSVFILFLGVSSIRDTYFVNKKVAEDREEFKKTGKQPFLKSLIEIRQSSQEEIERRQQKEAAKQQLQNAIQNQFFN